MDVHRQVMLLWVCDASRHALRDLAEQEDLLVPQENGRLEPRVAHTPQRVAHTPQRVAHAQIVVVPQENVRDNITNYYIDYYIDLYNK